MDARSDSKWLSMYSDVAERRGYKAALTRIAQGIHALFPTRSQEHKRLAELAPLAAAIDADIAAFDLAPVGLALAMKSGWCLARIRAAEIQFRLLITLYRKFPEMPLVPLDDDVDEYFHAALATNESYNRFCLELVGHIIIHDGFAGTRGAQDAVDQHQRHAATRRLVTEVSRCNPLYNPL